VGEQSNDSGPFIFEGYGEGGRGGEGGNGRCPGWGKRRGSEEREAKSLLSDTPRGKVSDMENTCGCEGEQDGGWQEIGSPDGGKGGQMGDLWKETLGAFNSAICKSKSTDLDGPGRRVCTIFVWLGAGAGIEMACGTSLIR